MRTHVSGKGDLVAKRKYFPFYESFLDGAQDLPDKQRLKFYDALAKYALLDETPELTGMALTCWKFAKPNIDNFIKNYDNGLKGGRPSKTVVSPMDKTTVLPKSETYKEKEKEKEKEKDKDKQLPTAAAAAPAPHNGAMGGRPLLDSSLTQQSDPTTEEARRKFFDSMKRPAWAAADAAPPDADTEELEDV